jgi:hypothetical protein
MIAPLLQVPPASRGEPKGLGSPCLQGEPQGGGYQLLFFCELWLGDWYETLWERGWG